jgi:hypothetical protein
LQHVHASKRRGGELVKVVIMESGQGLDEQVYLWKSKADPGRDLVGFA